MKDIFNSEGAIISLYSTNSVNVLFRSKIFDPNNTQDQFVIQVGTNGTAPEENIDTIRIGLEGLKFNSESLGLGKGSEIGPAELGGTAPARDEISAKLTTIDSALDRIASERATLGSVQSRLNSAINGLGVNVENMETARSRIKDVDIAAESARLTQSRILTQAGEVICMELGGMILELFQKKNLKFQCKV